MPRLRLALGVLLIAVAWPANWLLEGLRTHLFFFPLWLGYVLVVDGLTALSRGDSILQRSRTGFLALFLLSIPVWWLFELVNMRLENWEYVGRERFGDLAYALWCSLSFTIVVPAVLESAELVRGLPFVERLPRGPCVRSSRGLVIGLAVSGAVSLALMLAWPRAFFPFMWISGVLLLEPLCLVLGRRSLLLDLERGDWRPILSLCLGVLLCGFFWEMWNVRSYPKWIYHVPAVGEPKLFEMPVLGYLGYLPFALELYLLKELVLPGRPELRL